MNHDLNNGKSIGAILSDAKQELKDFVQTRIAMLRQELTEKLRMLKIAGPLGAAAIVFLGTAYLLFTLALVGLVLAFLRDNPYRWCLAFVVVAFLWTIIGGVGGYLAWREFQLKELMPNKTINVLNEDKIWIQSEVKNRV